MRCSLSFTALLLALCWQSVIAADFSGRFSMLGATARAEEGDWGYQESVGSIPTADQQSLRLMLDEGNDEAEWSAHLYTGRTHTHGFTTNDYHSSDLFRYADLGGTLLDESDATTSTTIRYELDHFYYRHHFNAYSVSLGRQAIDWGSGRFWQPLNIFGSFAPMALDTEYKPGIDVVSFDYFPSSFSSLTGVYTFAPQDQSEINNSGALHYRRQVGMRSELTLVAGRITGNTVVGSSFESAWKGIGWRIEGVHYQLETKDEQVLFWITGLDYQFKNGILLSVEYYNNSRGAVSESSLPEMHTDNLVITGLQQQLSRQLVGLGLALDLSPLLHGSYTLLGSVLKDESGSNAWSLLHQLNLTYSVSNESDLLASLLLSDGKGLSVSDEPRSEFGHIPTSLTLWLRFYF